MRMVLVFMWLVLPGVVWAACSSPSGAAGDVIFSNATKTMQYCNGSDWVNTGAVIPSAPQTGCTTPTGAAGHVIYNSALGVVQFCNGSNWVNTACATGRSLGGSGCGGKPAGSIQYVGGSVNELQFCDSTNWVAMGYPCGPVVPLNVADVFSTDLYTGNGSTQTITNGVNLAAKGGLVWTKTRADNANVGSFDTNISNWLVDSARGNYGLYSNKTDANQGTSGIVFGSSGYSTTNRTEINANTNTYASWTFRKAPKFFDVVTWTGNGASGRAISHNLGAEPGMIVVKSTSLNGSNFIVYHRSAGMSGGLPFYMYLNTTDSIQGPHPAIFPATLPTESTFYIGANATTNASGNTYVAYLFAHDDSADGVIQCGSYTGNGSVSGPTVTLGWQPQWFIIKQSSGSTNWVIMDKARTEDTGGDWEAVASTDRQLYPNLSNTETSGSWVDTSLSGFQVVTTSTALNSSGSTYIYCAIRAEGV